MRFMICGQGTTQHHEDQVKLPITESTQKLSRVAEVNVAPTGTSTMRLGCQGAEGQQSQPQCIISHAAQWFKILLMQAEKVRDKIHSKVCSEKKILTDHSVFNLQCV